MKTPDCCQTRWLLISVLLSSIVITVSSSKQKIFHKQKHPPGDKTGKETLQWGVKLNLADIVDKSASKKERDAVADIIAEAMGLKNDGPVGDLDDTYLFTHPLHKNNEDRQKSSENEVYKKNKKDYFDNLDLAAFDKKLHIAYSKIDHSLIDMEEFMKIRDAVHEQLNNSTLVEWFSQQILLKRYPRSVVRIQPHMPTFKDPYYPKQWHLVNRRHKGRDINVTGVWSYNVTGRGVTVSIIDDGVQWNHPDIKANYNPAGSRDLNDNDDDPMPHAWKATNGHGTRCAGEIAAVPNSVCAVGVAYGAKVSGIRALDGPITDRLEADAFNTKLKVNDIFSCSWGPDDDGKTVDGPHPLARKALVKGIEQGRGGYGTIYVVASGNGGRYIDNCNFDGYANSRFTVTIGAVDEYGNTPSYAEACSAMHAVTLSSGGGWGTRSIVTTDWTLRGGTGCTESHSGTSAAAPIGAGMIALILDVRPCLSWRDIQHLIIITAVKVDVKDADWAQNTAGLHHSHQHGFGLMDAWRLVTGAKVWPAVPFQTSFSSDYLKRNAPIKKSPGNFTDTFTVTKEMLSGLGLFSLEHVFVTVTATHKRRGYLEMRLRCPSGMESLIAARRALDKSSAGFKAWSFSTVRCWGESPLGTYTFIVTDRGILNGPNFSEGILVKWKLTIFGSSITPEGFKERLKKVHAAYSGEPLWANQSVVCLPPPPVTDTGAPITDKTLKILLLASVLCIIMAAYETFEYMCCYRDEKRETKQIMQMQQRAQRTSQNGGGASNAAERQGLLDAESPMDEDIAMETFSVARQPLNNSAFAEHDNSEQFPNGSAYLSNLSSDIPPDVLGRLSSEEMSLNLGLDLRGTHDAAQGASNYPDSTFSDPESDLFDPRGASECDTPARLNNS